MQTNNQFFAGNAGESPSAQYVEGQVMVSEQSQFEGDALNVGQGELNSNKENQNMQNKGVGQQVIDENH